jgi:hypothetical protein
LRRSRHRRAENDRENNQRTLHIDLLTQTNIP